MYVPYETRIRNNLRTKELCIVPYDETDSTNGRAIAYAKEHYPTEPMLFVAEEQYAGRGRLGRRFISNMGGIYMTLLLPANGIEDPMTLTTYAAVAVCRALEEETPLSPEIKWVNDIYIGERKLSGILVQGAIEPKSGKLTHVAVGIGMNVHSKVLDPEIAAIATSLDIEGVQIDKSVIAARIADQYLERMDEAGTPATIEEYRARSLLLGCDVDVITPEGTYTARAVGIGDKGELIVGFPDGNIRKLTYGEVSVRKTTKEEEW